MTGAVIGNIFVQVASITIPVGSYIVTGKVVLTNSSTGTGIVTCVLAQSGTGALVDRSDGSLGAVVSADTLVLHGAVTVTGATDGQLRVSCIRSTSGTTANATDAQLTAVRLGSVTTSSP